MTSTLIPSTQPSATSLPGTPRLNAPTVHRLSNGMTIIAEQMPVAAVNLNVWLPVGSAVESDSINGMAHFLEHMIFKGTARLHSGEFERRIEARGARTNAATSQDYTHYYITTAPQDFADLAPLQLDVVLNPMIPDAGFERERHVVLEEIRRSQDNARRRVFHHVSQLAFERLPYRRQVLGPAPVVEQLTAQQMRDFHNHWYHPAAMTVVAVGDLPVDQLIRIVEDSVTQAHSPASAAQRSVACTAPADSPPLHPPEVPFTRIRRCEVTDATLQQARLIMTWRVPGLTDLADTYALDVLASVLAQGRTARLVKDLREERGLVSGISASNTNYLHQGVFSISAQLPVAHIAAVEAEITQHIRDLQAGAVTAAELARVCTRVAKNFIFGNETPSDRTGLYGYYQALLGDLTPALLYPEVIQSLTLEDLQIAAQRFLCADAYGIVVVKPDAVEAEG